jgi:hypothetical protein
MRFQVCCGENHKQHTETAAMVLSSAMTRVKCLCASEKMSWKRRVHVRVYAKMWRNHTALQGNLLISSSVSDLDEEGLVLETAIPIGDSSAGREYYRLSQMGGRA